MTKHYCNAGCRESYHEDRKHGLIYSPCAVYLSDIPKNHSILKDITPDKVHKSHNSEDEFIVVSWEFAHDIYKTCYYCNSSLVKE